MKEDSPVREAATFDDPAKLLVILEPDELRTRLRAAESLHDSCVLVAGFNGGWQNLFDLVQDVRLLDLRYLGAGSELEEGLLAPASHLFGQLDEGIVAKHRPRDLDQLLIETKDLGDVVGSQVWLRRGKDRLWMMWLVRRPVVRWLRRRRLCLGLTFGGHHQVDQRGHRVLLQGGGLGDLDGLVVRPDARVDVVRDAIDAEFEEHGSVELGHAPGAHFRVDAPMDGFDVKSEQGVVLAELLEEGEHVARDGWIVTTIFDLGE